MKLKTVKDQFLHNDGFIYTLLRSGASAQLCGWIDTILAFVLFAFCHLTPWLSTAIGAFVGGVLNCVINYRFTFHATGVEWRAVVTKFLFVWLGSFLLNSFGTQITYYLISDWSWIGDTIGLGKDAIFLSARLLVALAVSLGWNFLLQRSFVFKTTRLDKHILKVLDRIGIKARNTGKELEQASQSPNEDETI